MLQCYGDSLLGRPSGDLLASLLAVPDVGDLSAREWLEATPLMRRLRRTLAEPD